jgi:hypothetical protein
LIMIMVVVIVKWEEALVVSVTVKVVIPQLDRCNSSSG